MSIISIISIHTTVQIFFEEFWTKLTDIRNTLKSQYNSEHSPPPSLFLSFGFARKPIWTHVRSSHRLMYRNNRKRQRVWTRKESSRDSSDFIRSNGKQSDVHHTVQCFLVFLSAFRSLLLLSLLLLLMLLLLLLLLLSLLLLLLLLSLFTIFFHPAARSRVWPSVNLLEM